MPSRNALVAAVGGVAAALLAYRFYGYAWTGAIAFVIAVPLVFLILEAVGGRGGTPRALAGAACAFVVAFLVTMPAGCTIGSASGAHSSEWSCQGVLGVQLPGFAGSGPLTPALWAPLGIAITSALAVVLARSRRRGEK